MFKKKKKAERVDYTDKTVDDVLADLQKKYGKESVRLLGDERVEKVEVISTGSLWINSALGIGGLPRGRVVEVYGPESSGKTTVALHCVAEANKKGGYGLYVDAEHGVDIAYAKRVGVQPDKLVLCQPDSGEQGLDILETSIASGKFAIAVVDSVSALTPKAELDGEMLDNQMALQARMMSKALRKITARAAKKKTLVIFINQIRSKVGVIFGNPEVTSGGNALKFYASVRLEIRKKEPIKMGEKKIIGNRVKVRIVKNKLAVPYKEIETDLIFGHGFSKEAELLELADDYDVIEIKGTKYYYEKKCFGKSKLDAIEALRKNKKLYKRLLAKVKNERNQDDD